MVNLFINIDTPANLSLRLEMLERGQNWFVGNDWSADYRLFDFSPEEHVIQLYVNKQDDNMSAISRNPPNIRAKLNKHDNK